MTNPVTIVLERTQTRLLLKALDEYLECCDPTKPFLERRQLMASIPINFDIVKDISIIIQDAEESVLVDKNEICANPDCAHKRSEHYLSGKSEPGCNMCGCDCKKFVKDNELNALEILTGALPCDVCRHSRAVHLFAGEKSVGCSVHECECKGFDNDLNKCLG